MPAIREPKDRSPRNLARYLVRVNAAWKGQTTRNARAVWDEMCDSEPPPEAFRTLVAAANELNKPLPPFVIARVRP